MSNTEPRNPRIGETTAIRKTKATTVENIAKQIIATYKPLL